jgi:hypothetical protein
VRVLSAPVVNQLIHGKVRSAIGSAPKRDANVQAKLCLALIQVVDRNGRSIFRARHDAAVDSVAASSVCRARFRSPRADAARESESATNPPPSAKSPSSSH